MQPESCLLSEVEERYKKIAEKMKETGDPLFVKVDGHVDAVVLSVHEYIRMVSRLAFYSFWAGDTQDVQFEPFPEPLGSYLEENVQREDI